MYVRYDKVVEYISGKSERELLQGIVFSLLGSNAMMDKQHCEYVNRAKALGVVISDNRARLDRIIGRVEELEALEKEVSMDKDSARAPP